MGSKLEVKLLGTKESLFTHRVIWALKLKGIDYEFVEEDLLKKSPLLLQTNPIYKKVPVLIHGGKAIAESLVILEYIDEAWKDRSPLILPRLPQERAYARFWAKFVDEKFYDAAIRAFFSGGEDKAKGVEELGEAFRILEEEITGKKYFGGETMGFLDFVMGWIAHWFEVVEEVGGFKAMDAAKYPALDAWKKTFLQVPIVRDNLPSPCALRRVFQGFLMMGLSGANAGEQE